MEILLALCMGYVLDLVVGDPLWLPHPVQAIGALIRVLEKGLRRLLPKTLRGQLAAGVCMVVCVCAVCWGVPFLLLWAAGLVHVWLRVALQAVMCWQVLATKSLAHAAKRVWRPLEQGDVESARAAVAMIVGRDTAALDAGGIARAAVETVAENTGDGVVAPLLFFALGGAPLAFLYKGINTMDSMVGYKNERYLYFGRPAARLDDVANFVPARLAALLLVAAAALCRMDWRAAFGILKRDRRNHQSPNSAAPEAACAGALGVRLGGDAVYGGRLVHKPTVGDAKRDIVPQDILRVCRLMRVASALGVLLCLALVAGIAAAAWGVAICRGNTAAMWWATR